ncbi:MAG: acetyltransferase [Tidjanibacter sp.]|nr:acetyltransferase [Tidjanibacter sp.]
MRSVIISAGTYGEVYLAYLQEAGVEVVGFLDDNKTIQGTNVKGVPVLGGVDLLQTLKSTYGIEAVYCPIGNNKLRVRFLSLAKELGYKTPNYIHPSVIISPNVTIGDGVYILLGTSIMPYTVIKDYVMISMNVGLAHHSILENGVFLSTGCNFGASIHANKYAYCGISSTIMTGIKELGEDCLIGAGAVVIRDVPDRAVVAGVPAKVIKYKE